MFKIDKIIVEQLKHIGENPERNGLLETPKRVIKSWEELYKGYSQNPADVFKEFDGEGYSGMVWLTDVELYSMCEHHMLPFFGKAHVAYIPNEKVIGISKLSRLVKIFSRRLQIQERICEQVASTLMEYLKPKGAACIIEASHMCMRMRGVNEQGSIMGTSSLKGEFMDDPAVRAEFLDHIKINKLGRL